MTVLAKVTLNESVELDFELAVSGTNSKDMDIRFIIEGPLYDISCRCIESSGTIKANIPKLNGVLQPGTYLAKLEIIVDGKHFQPLKEDIQFVMPMSIDVSPKIGIKEKSINICVNSVLSAKQKRLDEIAIKIQKYEEALAKVRKI